MYINTLFHMMYFCTNLAECLTLGKPGARMTCVLSIQMRFIRLSSFACTYHCWLKLVSCTKGDFHIVVIVIAAVLYLHYWVKLYNVSLLTCKIVKYTLDYLQWAVLCCKNYNIDC